MSEVVTNMFQYNVTVGITRSEVILLFQQVERYLLAESLFATCGLA